MEVARDEGDNVQAWALYEEALTLGRELGNKSGIAWSLSGLGDLAREQGDHAQARALLQEALALRRELGNKWGIFTYELARRLEGSGVTANCLHPGLIATGFGHNNGGLLSLGLRLIRPFVKKPERGAETSVYLASLPEVAAVSGRYFYNKRATRSSPASYDVEAAHRLWHISADMTGLTAQAGRA